MNEPEDALTEDEIWGWEWLTLPKHTFKQEPVETPVGTLYSEYDYAIYIAPSGTTYLRTTANALCFVEAINPDIRVSPFHQIVFPGGFLPDGVTPNKGLKEKAREAVARHERLLMTREPRTVPVPTPAEMFDLVPLSSLPESSWKGLAVFHPCGQQGSTCQWVADDLTGTTVGEPAYDVGVVERWEPDPDFADLGIVRVWFVGSFGSRLHYASSNLWTPKRNSHGSVA